MGFFVVVAFLALSFWLGALYFTSTKEVAEYGGEYAEGIAGQPRYINPILSQTSEADAALSELVYSGLFGYDEQGELVKRLAAEYSIADEGKLYTVTLRQGVRWHDGEELSADDVLFTIRAIQDPAFKSPLRANWLSVDVAAVDRYTVTFTLKKSYFGFLENLTLGILPKHIWENIAPENFLLADYNLSPIGSGPYVFYDSERDSNGNMLSYELRAFSEYFEGMPYIAKIIFHFYPDEDTLIDAYNRKEVSGMYSVTPENLVRLEERKSTRIYELNIPRVFAVFFNISKSVPLAYDEVREALSLATEREALIREVLSGKGQPAFSTILPFMRGYNEEVSFPRFDKEKANALLEEKEWKRGEDGVRAKNGTVLQIKLLVPDWPQLVATAELLKQQWEAVGARIEVVVLGAADLQQNAIRPREYEALLFGEAIMHADPFSFWHSSQKQDPGLNLALFDDKEADDVLTALREELDLEKRREKYKTFQEILVREHPAVFLYAPTHLYVANNTLHNMNTRTLDATQYRLSNAKNWYIKTKRVRK
ncbi:MAG: peptide ABC transporter substrate-binding protein [Candidatus Moranbacteria bacterium]|nr:peptide ABC transporter substrate-binding protein [Candidatus Moranbacteria bacterium]